MAQHNVQLNVTQSTFLDKANPNTNYGNLEYLRSGIKDVEWHGGVGDVVGRYIILINWPHDVIPPRKKIISATLALYSRRFVAAASPYEMLLMHRVLEDWDESTATYNNAVWDRSYSTTYMYRGDIPLNSILYFSLRPSIIYDPNGVAIDGPWLEGVYAEFNSTRASSNKPYINVVYEDVPPDKPTLIAPIGIYKDSKSVIRFEWQYNSDVGGTQKAFDLQWSIDQANWTTVSLTTANNYYDMPANTLPAGNIYWRVRTYNEYDEVGPYCDIQSFYAIGAPAAPVLNAVPTNSARPIISWSAFGQQVYQLQVLSGDTIVYDSGVVPGISIRSHKVKAWLADGEYTVRLRIKSEYDMWSEWGSTAVTISTDKPEKPSIALRRSEYGIELQIADMADYALIYRSDYGTDDYVCIGKTTSTTYIDNSVRNKAEYQYYVRSVAEMASDVETYEDSDTQFIQVEFRHSLIAPVSDMSNIFAFTRSLDTPPKRVYDRAPGGAYVLYAGRTYPVWEPSEHISTGLSLTFFLRTWAEVESFVALYDRKETVLYRDVKGRKIYGVMSGLQVTEDRTGYVVSFLLNQVDHDEEVEV